MLVFLTIFSFLLDSYLKFSSSYYALLIQNINPILHIRCKLIQVIPTQQPNRVLIHKPTHIRLVIPEEVVMQHSLAVSVLVLQAEGLVCAIRYSGFLFQTTPAGIVAEPNQITVLIGHLTQFRIVFSDGMVLFLLDLPNNKYFQNWLFKIF